MLDIESLHHAKAGWKGFWSSILDSIIVTKLYFSVSSEGCKKKKKPKKLAELITGLVFCENKTHLEQCLD